MAERDAPTGPFTLGLGEDVDLLRFQEEAGAVEGPPEALAMSPADWMKANLFSSPFNTITTVLAAAFIVFVVFQGLVFVFVNAEWRVIQVSMKGYMVGGFPIEEVWRIWVSIYLLAILAGLSAGMLNVKIRWTRGRLIGGVLATAVALLGLTYTTTTWTPRLLALGAVATVFAAWAGGRLFGSRLRRPLIIGWILAFPAIIFIVREFDGVPPEQWEGFFFNMIAATVGIVASFPIGILLALGRRSSLPAVRTVCVVFIEIFRGVPLVAWLIFSKFVVDLLLPPQMDVPDIIKAFIAMTLFSAAYVGEIVRGGLQGVPHGQYEAARALGLPTTRMMALVVLPQALRSTIPAMISHFISLFKDTSLFVAIEVTELLAATRRSANSLEFLGQDTETLLFAALMFWAVAFTMSRWSQRLELRLGVGER
jgi:general L-amino acid transport system permease protein